MPTPTSVFLRASLVAACVLSTPGAWSQSTYEQDRAACLRSDSQHERTSCLREAGAVRAQGARKLPMAGETAESRMQNALKRCTELPAESKATCERMVRGEGTVSGSVAGGGQIRELVTPAPAVAPMPPMPPGQPAPQPMPPMQPMPGAPVVR